MDNIITLYRCTCTSGVYAEDQGTGISLLPWGEDTPQIQGYDDGGRQYILPEGYTLSETAAGEPAIYHDATGDYCELSLRGGKVQLWHLRLGVDGKPVTLRMVK